MAAPMQSLLLLGALLAPSAARPPAANNASAAPTGVEVRVGAVLPEDSRLFPWAWPRVAPALRLALEELGLAGLAVRTAFDASDENSGCDQEASLFKAADLRSSHHLDVLLGLGCQDFNFLLEPFVQYWRLPLLVAGPYRSSGSVPIPEVVYAGPLGRSLHTFQARLLEHFHWTRRAVLALGSDTDSGRYCDFLWRSRGSTSMLDLGRPGVSVFLFGYEEPGEAIRKIQAEGRVAFICGSLEILHQIMHLAHARNMTNGDYVFIYLDHYQESLRAYGHRETGKPWQSNETQDTGGLQEVFQTVLVITAHEPQTPEYRHFENELVLRAQRDFGAAINDSLGHLVSGCYHDGLLLYLRALNETLHEGGTKRNTRHILGKMRSLKFQGVTGMVSINRNNEREMDFDLWAMRDVETGEFQVVGHYIASEERINWKGDILWKKGAPPLDNPPCVFKQDDPSCDQDTEPIHICQWSVDGSDNLVTLGSTFF